VWFREDFESNPDLLEARLRWVTKARSVLTGTKDLIGGFFKGCFLMIGVFLFACDKT
jgi:hypothetical protein